MKKTLVPAAVAVLFVMTSSSIAWAQDDAPSDAVKSAICGSASVDAIDDAATVRVSDAAAQLKSAQDALDDDGSDAAKGVNPNRLADVDARIAAIEDHIAKTDENGKKEFGGYLATYKTLRTALVERDSAAAELRVADDLEAAVRAFLDGRDFATVKDEVCEPSTTENPPPADDETPPVEDDDEPGLNPEYDCRDFPLTDGTTAQDILNADRTDPHKLDLDSDGIACETSENHAGRDSDGDGVIDNRGVVEEDSLDDDSTGGLTENVAVPSGGVATGGGPA